MPLVWRRGRDSNPRGSFPPTVLAGPRLQPLGHLSLPCLALDLASLRTLTLIRASIQSVPRSDPCLDPCVALLVDPFAVVRFRPVWRRVRDSNPRTVEPSTVFKTVAFDRSANPPGLEREVRAVSGRKYTEPRARCQRFGRCRRGASHAIAAPTSAPNARLPPPHTATPTLGNAKRQKTPSVATNTNPTPMAYPSRSTTPLFSMASV
jgi:hypothetical protein